MTYNVFGGTLNLAQSINLAERVISLDIVKTRWMARGTSLTMLGSHDH